MKKYLAQFNTYPFFLFKTYSKEAQVDLEKMEMNTDLNGSRLDPVPVWQVALIKYVPVLLMVALSNMPNSWIEAFVATIALVSFLLFMYLWNLNTTLSKFAFVGLVIVVYFLHFKVGVNAVFIHWYLGYMLTSFLLYYVAYDIYKKQYKDYYLLVDIGGTQRIQIATRKKRPLVMIPFLSKFTKDKREGIFYVNQGFNLGFNVFLKGYFMRIVKELHVSEENTNEAK